MNKIIILLTIITMPLTAQRMIDNPWLYNDLSETRQVIQLADNVQVRYGLEFWMYGQNSLVLPLDMYADKLYWGASPLINAEVGERLHVNFRARGQSARHELIDTNRKYTGYDDFRGMQGEIEVSDLTYTGEYVHAAFGRQYFTMNDLKAPDLILSRHIRPADRFLWGLGSGWAHIETGYFVLDNLVSGGVVSKRYLNYHRLILGHAEKSYFAVTEVLIYGGPHRQPEYFLLNPFQIYHLVQMNTQGDPYNTLVCLEWRIRYENLYTEGQFLVDDFQVDKEVPGDLEPNELGLSLTAGWDNPENPFNFWTNYTMVRNRTYNAPVHDEEKYLHKNLPIGHWWGNNFWSVQLTGEYKHRKLIADFTWMYREYGDEAMYSEFNIDYLNYTVEEGYNEPFPFGTIHKQHGIYGNAAYLLKDWLLINGSASYWFHPGELPKNFGLRLGFGLRL